MVTTEPKVQPFGEIGPVGTTVTTTPARPGVVLPIRRPLAVLDLRDAEVHLRAESDVPDGSAVGR